MNYHGSFRFVRAAKIRFPLSMDGDIELFAQMKEEIITI